MLKNIVIFEDFVGFDPYEDSKTPNFGWEFFYALKNALLDIFFCQKEVHIIIPLYIIPYIIIQSRRT